MTAERAGVARSFGDKLRALREAAGLTQEELAERAGVTTHAVSALERGTRTRPYPHTVRSLADALGLDETARGALLAAVPRRGAARPVLESAGPAVQALAAGEPAGGGAPAGAFPVPSSALLGRDEDIRALGELVRRPGVRLVTLTGAGGVGKTRLAVVVAEQAAAAFADGVAYVALAPVTDPALVLPTIGRSVGMGPVEGLDVEALVTEHLRPLSRLLVLDNFEHLAEAAAQVARLVAACPQLTVLVSSRAALRVRGETEYPVSPLALPPDGAPGPAEVAASPACSLFLERATSVAPGFALTSGNAGAVAAICRRLAGIPLALELAAARARVLDPEALLARLDDAMSRGGARDLPERQQTMRATLDWSYGLLQPAEQRLFRRLSVFSSGFTLEAAEAVAPDPEADVLGVLEGLVEQSLVVVTSDPAGRLRYAMLEPISQYARSLLDVDEALEAGNAHAAFFLALAERAEPKYLGAEQVEWLSRIDAEHSNMSGAIEWSLAHDDATTAGRMGWALWLFWWLRGRLLLGRRYMEQALLSPLPPEVHALTQNTAAAMAFAQGDLAAAGPAWERARDLAIACGSRDVEAYTRGGVGLVALASGDLDAAEEQFRLARDLVDGVEGWGDWLTSLTSTWIGTVLMLRGDAVGAVASIEHGLANARRRGDRLATYIALYNLSQAAVAQGDHVTSRRHLEEGIALSVETGDLANLAYFLDMLAVVEDSRDEPHRVAVLLGAAQALRETVGSNVYGYYQPDEALRENAAERACAMLGEDAYGDALDVGRALEPAEAAVYAVGSARDRAAT